MMKNLMSTDTASLKKVTEGTVPVLGLSPEALETRALTYKLVSVGFLYPERLWKERMSALIEEFNHTDFAPEPKEIKEISVFLSKGDSLERLQIEHFRLFGHDPLCPLDITHWTKGGQLFMQTPQMADMAGFYRAFGLDINESERVDNISVVFEFMSYLCLKILHASEIGDDNNVEITEIALNKFILGFVRPSLGGFVKSLKRHSNTCFYISLAELAEKWTGEK